MGSVSNSSTYAVAIHMIGQAVVAGIFLIALIALVVLIVFGVKFESKTKRWCSGPIQKRITITLMITMTLTQILVWSLVQGFDLIPIWAAALLCLIVGVPLILATDRVLKSPDFKPSQVAAWVSTLCSSSSARRKGNTAYPADILLP
eukprot:PhF_6_TR25994/c0_g1_i1/m.36646